MPARIDEPSACLMHAKGAFYLVFQLRIYLCTGTCNVRWIEWPILYLQTHSHSNQQWPCSKPVTTSNSITNSISKYTQRFSGASCWRVTFIPYTSALSLSPSSTSVPFQPSQNRFFSLTQLHSPILSASKRMKIKSKNNYYLNFSINNYIIRLWLCLQHHCLPIILYFLHLYNISLC